MPPAPPPASSTGPHTRSAINNSTQPFFIETTNVFTSNVKDRRVNPGGVLYVKGNSPNDPFKHYWLDDLITVERAAAFFLPLRFSHYSFTAYTSQADWTTAYPLAPIFAVFTLPAPPPPRTPAPQPTCLPSGSSSTTAYSSPTMSTKGGAQLRI